MILQNKVKSTFMVDGEVYKKIRILAIEKNMEVSAIIEEAMREKLDREYPAQYTQHQPQPQEQQPQQKQESDMFEKDIISPISGLEAEMRLKMPDLEFPISRDNLIIYGIGLRDKQIRYRVEHGMFDKNKIPFNLTSFIIAKLTSNLPKSKTYKNIEELKGDLQRVITHDKEVIDKLKKFTPLKTVGCTIDTRSIEGLNLDAKPKSENLVKTSR